MHMEAQDYAAKVIDDKTEVPIPYATVKYGEHRGVITNEEGVFNITSEQLKDADSIYIASLGYEKLAVALTSDFPSVIRLIPEPFELKGVFLTDNQPPVEAIIDSVKAHFATDSISRIIPRNSSYYREALCEYYGNYEGHKLQVIKAAELYDKSNDGSIDALAEKLERIFKENVKPDSYLKIKSGLFGTKVQLDSITENNEDAQAIQVEVNDTDDENFHQAIKDRINELYEMILE